MSQRLESIRAVALLASLCALGCGCDTTPRSTASSDATSERPAHDQSRNSRQDSADAEIEIPSTTTLRTGNDTYTVAYKTPVPIPLNRLFEVEVWVRGSEPNSALELRVDAAMPHHHHGMNRTPVVEKRGPGHYLVSGMLFHMPGRWQMYFDVTNGPFTERAQDDVHLE